MEWILKKVKHEYESGDGVDHTPLQNQLRLDAGGPRDGSRHRVHPTISSGWTEVEPDMVLTALHLR